MSIKVQIGSGNLIGFITNTTVDKFGKVNFFITSDTVMPRKTQMNMLLFPSGDQSGFTTDAMLPIILSSGNYYLLATMFTSGMYYSSKKTSMIPSVISETFPMNFKDNNTDFKLGYLIEQHDPVSDYLLFPPVSGVITDIHIPIERPNPDKIMFPQDSSGKNRPMSAEIGFTSGLVNPRLKLVIPYDEEVPNSTTDFYGSSPYWVTVQDILNKKYRDTSGVIRDGVGTTGWYTVFCDPMSKGINLDLPYHLKQNYFIGLTFVDRWGVKSPPLVISTENIKLASNLFDKTAAKDLDSSQLVKMPAVAVTKEIISKKRCMVGIEDICLQNETYAKQGIYISDYYNLDNPLYTFSLKSEEILPAIEGIDSYSTTKYFVEFQKQEWLQISPKHRINERDLNKNIIPKLFVLDDIGISSYDASIKELGYKFPVYSFRIKIVMDLSSVPGDLHISPEIKSYCCEIVDKNFMLQI